jgi:hypothetical protein
MQTLPYEHLRNAEPADIHPFGLHGHEGMCLSLDLYGVFFRLIWVGNEEGFFGLDVYTLMAGLSSCRIIYGAIIFVET